jgi:hypothetical protein
LCLVLFVAWEPAARADPAEDNYIAGYATAVLEKEFNITEGSVSVQDGVVIVAIDHVAGAERDRMIASLSRIKKVKRVEVVPRSKQVPLPAGVPVPSATEPAGAVTVPVSQPPSQWLPRGLLFDPLHADPRWPHFAATFRRYPDRGEGGVKNAVAGDFGETVALYRSRAPFSGQWEFGFQAGVFSLFDQEGSSFDLINADYILSMMASYRSGDLSGFLRYLHQSSHLGDEFLLNNNVQRLNYSFEEVDAKLSYDLFDILRLYGGGGAIVRSDPSNLKVWRTEYGVELQSPKRLYRGIRPVAYADFQTNEQNNWSTNVSIRGGLQFENVRILDRSLQLLVEYYSGYSPNGQFTLTNRIQTIGLGLHFYF